MKKDRQTIKYGDIVSIPLKWWKKYMYCLISKEWESIFKIITDEVVDDVDLISKWGFLFTTWIYSDVLKSTEWHKVWKISNFDIVNPLVWYIYDIVSKKINIYQNDTIWQEINIEDAYDLEFIWAYDKFHIECILDYYIDTWFYHPRVWDWFNDGFWRWWKNLDKCIYGEFSLKSVEHIKHAKNIYEKYFLAVIEGRENELF